MNEVNAFRVWMEEARENEYDWKLSALSLFEYLNIDSDVIELCREVLAFAFDRVKIDSVLSAARKVSARMKS